MARQKKEEKLLEIELLKGCSSHPDRLAHLIFAFTLFWIAFGASLLSLNYLPLAVALAFALVPDFDIFLLHRELLHNLFALFLIPAIFNLFFHGTFQFAFLGYGSHILLDLLSPSGEALLFPFSRGRTGLGLVRSGAPTLVVAIIIFVITMLLKPLPFLPSFLPRFI